MKTAFTAVIVLLLFGISATAQVKPQSQAAPQGVQGDTQAVNLNAVLVQVQQSTSSASVDIGKLRVEKWKTDADQKQQLQHIAESLQKSIANAVPALVTNVQSSNGSVSTTFKLYHNLNVIYENLNYLADVAGGLGKKEEFDPLAEDCAAMEKARQSLSLYITESAGKLEAANRQPNGTIPGSASQAQGVQGKKVVVINEDDPPAKKTVKPAKKKPSTPTNATAQPTPAQSAAAPH